MAISAAAIIAYATQPHKVNIPGISDEVRNRLEWTWGLGHNHLDEHLEGFADLQHLLTDDSLLVIPRSDIMRDVWTRNRTAKTGVPRSHIQRVYKGAKSFEYLILPIDASAPPRILLSDLPPHLVMCTTWGKIMKAWGQLIGTEFDAMRVSLVERSKAAVYGDRPALRLSDLDTLRRTHWTWSLVDYVPPSFLSEDSDQTMVAAEESSDSSSDSLDSDVGSSASCSRKPQCRVLPCELQQDPPTRLFPSAADDEDDEDDAMSMDSHITGIEDPDEFAKASLARGDYELDREWLRGIKSWAESTLGAGDGDEKMLLNEIKEVPREQARVAASLDLDKPDYLSKHRGRTAT
ncbi:hypothetical protein C8R44DRAFT_808529 [Mycena epipterygia]|nr:hypothetical protein C8R44DRAFT_808529 [Mycena epipterygia]